MTTDWQLRLLYDTPVSPAMQSFTLGKPPGNQPDIPHSSLVIYMLIWICPLFVFFWECWLLADYNKLTDCTVDDVAMVT